MDFSTCWKDVGTMSKILCYLINVEFYFSIYGKIVDVVLMSFQHVEKYSQWLPWVPTGKKIQNPKWKNTCVFIFQNYCKSWSNSLGHFIQHELLLFLRSERLEEGETLTDLQVTQLIYSQDFNENCHEVLDRHKFLEMLIDVCTHQ